MIATRTSATIILVLLLIHGHVAADDANRTANKHPSFRRDIVPVLERVSCATTVCHGMPSADAPGRLSLSLFAGDPQADHRALTKEHAGRRISRLDSARSLLLHAVTAKDKCDVLTRDSADYHTLLRWLTAGAPGPDDDPLRLEQLQITPGKPLAGAAEARELFYSGTGEAAGYSVRFRVTARWSDGVTLDVSDLAKLQSSDNDVATIAATNNVVIREPGRSVITARYAGTTAAHVQIVPLAPTRSSFDLSPDNFIDEHMSATWQAAGLTPATSIDDRAYMRRTYVKLLGRTPTRSEFLAFLRSPRKDRRRQLVEQLLEHPDFAENWSYHWADWLLAESEQRANHDAFAGWVATQLAADVRLDCIVHQVVTATGSAAQNGAIHFYHDCNTPVDAAEATARRLLGVQLECARCHAHPHEPWQPRTVSALANCFADVEWQHENGAIVSVRDRKPQSPTQDVEPRLLGHSISAVPARRRVVLADTIVRAERRRLASYFANRYWSAMFATGLTTPEDDLRPTNPSVHSQLLEALTTDLIRHDFDAKRLLRLICNSQTFQLASEPVAMEGLPTMRCFRAYYQPHRMKWWQMQKSTQLILGERVVWPVPFGMPFLSTTGVPARSECTRNGNQVPTPTSGLVTINSTDVSRVLSDPQGRVHRVIATEQTEDRITERFAIETLSRSLTEEKWKSIRQFLAKNKGPRHKAFEDLVWALMNSAEFFFVN